MEKTDVCCNALLMHKKPSEALEHVFRAFGVLSDGVRFPLFLSIFLNLIRTCGNLTGLRLNLRCLKLPAFVYNMSNVFQRDVYFTNTSRSFKIVI